MLVLVIIDTVLVILLTGLVAGLLRSHTEILRVLGSMKAPRPEPPSAEAEAPAGTTSLDPESAVQVQIRR